MALVFALYQFVILLFSLSVHESAHAWMASRLGDYTARLEGRITLNPIRHIDLIGTIIYPALMILGPLIGLGGSTTVFGWGKPTPVITRNLKKITLYDNLIALAGPVANLLLAIAAFLVMLLLVLFIPAGRDVLTGASAASAPEAVVMLLWLTIKVNLALFFFNFLPIPPLDASRIVRNLLPYNSLNTFDAIGRFGFVVIFILGRYVVAFFLGPAMAIVGAILSHFLQPR
jgi:Zn-dependent protease